MDALHQALGFFFSKVMFVAWDSISSVEGHRGILQGSACHNLPLRCSDQGRAPLEPFHRSSSIISQGESIQEGMLQIADLM